MIIENLVFAFLGAIITGAFFYLYLRKRLRDKGTEFEEEVSKLTSLSEKEYNKVVSQRKSSEVRLGKVAENMAPFVKEWPYDPNEFRFIGNPVDGIVFRADEIIFVEIKTGKAKYTESQKTVKNIVKEGKVSFATFRVDENGAVFKRDE